MSGGEHLRRSIMLGPVTAFLSALLTGCGGTIPDPLNLTGTKTATQAASIQLTGNVAVDAMQFDPIISKVKTYAAGDLDNAIADAQSQVPPDTAAMGCWQTIKLALPVLNFPAQTGAVTLIQKARDAVHWAPIIIQQCNNIIPTVP